MVIVAISMLAEAKANPSANGNGQDFQPYILCVFTAIVSYAAGRWHDRFTRTRQARDRFLAVLADQRSKFDALKWKEAEFFEQSVPAFRDAVYGVQYFIPTAHWDCLHAVLQDYQSHHKSEFEGGRTRLAAAFNAERGEGKVHSEVLREYLDRFDDCIHGRMSAPNTALEPTGIAH